jgi:hypothetical protein
MAGMRGNCARRKGVVSVGSGSAASCWSYVPATPGVRGDDPVECLEGAWSIRTASALTCTFPPYWRPVSDSVGRMWDEAALGSVGCWCVSAAPSSASHIIFTRSKPRAETIVPLLDVLDLRAEEGKVSGLKLFHTTNSGVTEITPRLAEAEADVQGLEPV